MGRADVAVFAEGSLKEISRAVTSIFGIKGVVATESVDWPLPPSCSLDFRRRPTQERLTRCSRGTRIQPPEDRKR